MCMNVRWKSWRIAALLSAIALAGCGVEAAKRQLGEGIMPPVLNPMTELNRSLRDLPPPNRKVVVAVYNYADQTGQFKPADNVQSLSRAVTQGATSVIIKSLQDAGNGSWFTVVEREKLDNLLKERRIIAEMRKTYLGEENVNPQALPPLLFAGILLEGGIIGYDSNLQTGGIGARLLGIGGDIKYRLDTITIYLRAVSTKNGQVLANVVTHKTIASIGLQGGVFKYIAIDKVLDAEAGFTKNEPEQLAVQQAIEKAVHALVIEGADQGLWSFSDKDYQAKAIDDYRAQLFSASGHTAQARDPGVKFAGDDAAIGEGAGPTSATPATAVAAPQPQTAPPATAAASRLGAKRNGTKAAAKPPAKRPGGSGSVTMLAPPPGKAKPAEAQN